MEKNIISVLGRAYTYDILLLLENKSPARFKEISPACMHDKIRAQRLRELESFGLVKADLKRLKGRAILFYSISPKGKEALGHMKEIKKLHS